MGGACSRYGCERRSVYELSRAPKPQRQSQRPLAWLAADGWLEPPSLLHLCVSFVAEHLETFPELSLPADLADLVLTCSRDRAWLDLPALRQLRSCDLHTIELPAFAPLSPLWVDAIALHTELVGLDLSSAPRLSDSAVAPIARIHSLRDLNLSRCRGLGDETLRLIGTSLRCLSRLSLESLPLVTDCGIAELRSLRSVRSLSLAGCAQLGDAAVAAITHPSARPKRLQALTCPPLT